jgi:hypothetical protein
MWIAIVLVGVLLIVVIGAHLCVLKGPISEVDYFDYWE